MNSKEPSPPATRDFVAGAITGLTTAIKQSEERLRSEITASDPEDLERLLAKLSFLGGINDHPAAGCCSAERGYAARLTAP